MLNGIPVMQSMAHQVAQNCQHLAFARNVVELVLEGQRGSGGRRFHGCFGSAVQ